MAGCATGTRVRVDAPYRPPSLLPSLLSSLLSTLTPPRRPRPTTTNPPDPLRAHLSCAFQPALAVRCRFPRRRHCWLRPQRRPANRDSVLARPPTSEGTTGQ